MTDDKKNLRRSLLKQRQALTVEEWQDKSDRICTHLRSTSRFKTAQTILTYLSFRQEPDLSSLWNDRLFWGVPRCVETSLVWHRWQPGDSLKSGAYGILEPDPELPEIDPEAVDLILVPAVACDDRGYRLGYGGGYYDRLFSLPQWAAKPSIGIVFEFARVPNLPIEPWDKSLNAICTEAGYFPLS